LKRALLVIASVVVLLAVIVTVIAMGFFGGNTQPRYNVVEIYVLSWDINTTQPNDSIDVQFRISIDSDNDGAYDLVRTSELFRNTTVESAPFRVGDIVPTSMSGFQFKVEVFRSANGTFEPMNYDRSGTNPTCAGINDVTFSKVWKFDATDGTEKSALDCRISFVCYVDSKS
jgi:hypothetical protein